jgi:hypothetical protein
LDLFEKSAGILSVALGGATRARIVASNQHLIQHEIWWLLETLVDRNLLELDSYSAYRTTDSGVKFLEIRFNMERMLQEEKRLV